MRLRIWWIQLTVLNIFPAETPKSFFAKEKNVISLEASISGT